MLARKTGILRPLRFKIVTAIAAMFIAASALAGWVLNLEILKTVFPDSFSMKVNTALSILFSGLSLLLFISGKNRQGALFFAFLVFFTGAVSLSEYLFHWDAGIDELFFNDSLIAQGKYPGRMSPITAAGFILLGISLLTHTFKTIIGLRISEFSAIAVLLIGFSAFIGYLYGSSRLYQIAELTSIAVNTAVAFLFLGVAIMNSKQDSGLMAAFNKKTNAARIGILEVAILITMSLLTGLICLKLVNTRIIDTELGISVMVIFFAITFFFVTWSGTKRLNRLELERKKAEVTLKESEEKYRTLFEQSPAGIYQATLKGKIVSCNNAFAVMLGYSSFAELPEKDSSCFYFYTDERDTSIAELLKKSELINHEIVLKHKDGSPVYLIENCFLRKDTITSEDIIEGMMIDITEQRKNNTALKESEESLRQILSSTADNFYVINRSYYITLINESAEKNLTIAWGHPVTGGTNILDFIPDEKDEPIRSSLKKVFAGKKVEYELHLTVAGLPEWVLVTYLPVNDDSGAIIGAYIVTKDISERKKAKLALIDSEKRYRSLFEQASDGILVTDLQGNIVEINSMLCVMFGYLREEALKKNVTSFLDPQNLLVQPLRLNLLQGDQSLLFERKAIHKNGTPFDIELNTKLFGEEKALSIIRNISERKIAEKIVKESEEKYRTLVENAPEALVVFDVEKRSFVSVSESAVELFKFSKNEFYKLGPLDISPEYQPDGKLSSESVMENIREAIAGGKPIFEWTHCDKAGNLIPCEVRLVRIPSETQLLIRGSITDITERKKSELALKESEEKYRSVIEQATDFIMITDNQGNFIDANSNFCKTFGYTKNELAKLNINNVIEPSDLKARPIRFDLLFRGETLLNERRMMDRNGGIIDVEANVKMLPDGRLMAIARDIRDRKSAEEEILKTNARFQVVSKATSDIVWDWDVVNGSIWWNDNYYSLLGIKKEKEFTDLDHWYKRIHPDDLNRVRKDVEKAKNEKNNLRSHEYRYRKEDGTYLYFLDRSFVFRNQNGEPYRMIGSMVDMTPVYKAQKEVVESEIKLRTIYETEPECIKLLSDKGELLDMNPAGLAMIEADNLDMVKGKPVLGIIAQPYQKAFDKLTKDVFKGKSGTLEFEIIGLKGTHRWLETHAVPMLDAAKTITALLGVTRDVTEKRKYVQELRESKNFQESILSALASAICVIDKNGFILSVNETWLKFGEENQANLTSIDTDANYLEVCKKSSERSDPYAAEALKGITDVLESTSDFFILEYPCHSKEEKRWFQMRVTPFNRSMGGAVINHINITQRKMAEQTIKDSEEKYRTLIEQAVDAIALYDAAGKILDVNTGSVNLLGYSKVELMNMYLSDVLTKEEIKARPVQYETLQKGNSTVKQRMMRRKDNTIVETEVRSQQLPDGRFLSVIRDLSDRKKAEHELDESYKAVRKLTGYLQNIREQERTHIAREIHDELGQQLTVLKMDVSWLNRKIASSDEAIKDKMKSLLTMLDETVKSVRRISSELRPSLLDDLGLIAAMEWQLAEFEKRSGIKCGFINSGKEFKLQESVKTALFRIFQESLTNVARHSVATNLTVSLFEKDNSLCLSIADDGKGFDLKKIVDKRTLGILGMKERAAMIDGIYDIKSSTGKGTTVSLTIPFTIK